MLETPPPGFPNNTLPIQRVLTSISLSHPQSLPSAIALFWQNFWVHWTDPLKPENMLAIVKTIVGSEEEALKVIERAKSEEVKKKLATSTDQAYKDGAFGLPWFVGESRFESYIMNKVQRLISLATNAKGETEGFWGVDHLGAVCDHLGLERPSDKAWRALL